MKFIATLFGVKLYAETEDEYELKQISDYLEKNLGYKPKTDAELDKEVRQALKGT